jgi:monofunctional biosynthetic peptidoglycan transglycosylase
VKRFFKLFGALAACGLAYAVWVFWGLPPRDAVRALARKNPETTGVMKQRAEEARRKQRAPGRDRIWVPIDRVSRNLIHAVVAAEDPKFFGHEGIDWDAVRESAETDWKRKGFVRGGSTITQQLAKNLYFTTHKSVTRKLREFVVARWLESDLSKRRILELYLNLIEWGDGVYGCEAAARRYYGKSAADLSEDEAAGLAAMIPSPRRLNPRVSPARHAQAQRRILWLMAHAGYVRRDVGGLGAEPPPPVPEPEEDEEDLVIEEAPLSSPLPAPETLPTPLEAPASPAPSPTLPEAMPAESPPTAAKL